MRKIEFYITPEAEVMIRMDGVSEPFKAHKSEHMQLTKWIISQIETFYPKAYKALKELYASCPNAIMAEYKIACRFIRCNFGTYDTMTADLDESGLFNFEQLPCPVRCECKYSGIICNPTYCSGLTKREIEISRLIVDGAKLVEIAAKLYISKNTAATHLRNIHRKTKTGSVAELVTYWHKHKLK